MRPAGKARRLRIPGVFEGGATLPGGDAAADECRRIYAADHEASMAARGEIRLPAPLLVQVRPRSASEAKPRDSRGT